MADQRETGKQSHPQDSTPQSTDILLLSPETKGFDLATAANEILDRVATAFALKGNEASVIWKSKDDEGETVLQLTRTLKQTHLDVWHLDPLGRGDTTIFVQGARADRESMHGMTIFRNLGNPGTDQESALKESSSAARAINEALDKILPTSE